MKKNLIYIALVAIVFTTTAAFQVSEECDSRALKGELKKELKPDYKYDSSKTSRFTYKNKKQLKEIEVPVYMGEKYRFLFNTAGLPKDIKIEVYNKPVGHKKRKLLYTLEKKEGKHIYSFNPDKSRKMYVNYTIPAVEETELRGCIIFLLGYKMKL
jgi:hypothetical protein